MWFFSGEALGAIGNPDVLEVLKQYSTDPVIEVPWPKTPAPAWTSLPWSLVARATAWPGSAGRGQPPGWSQATALFGKTKLIPTLNPARLTRLTSPLPPSPVLMPGSR